MQDLLMRGLAMQDLAMQDKDQTKPKAPCRKHRRGWVHAADICDMGKCDMGKCDVGKRDVGKPTGDGVVIATALCP